MTQMRRKFRLINSDYKEMDLTTYSKEIIDAVNSVAPNENPRVYKSYFSTDPLEQREAVALGRALAKIKGLSNFGMEIKTYRLFSGRNYESEASDEPINNVKKARKTIRKVSDTQPKQEQDKEETDWL